MVDLVLQPELSPLPLLLHGVAQHVNHRPRRVHQLVVVVVFLTEQRVRQVLVVALLLLLLLLGGGLLHVALRHVAGRRVEHDGLVGAVVLLGGLLLARVVVLAHDGVDLVVDGADEELPVAEDAEDEEARLQGARLGAHRRRLGLDDGDDGGQHLLEECGSLGLHLDYS
uniref:Uncharacterized protein n=1 Tax=Triticum urartu TaxID=4572 RepID=A0A8R7PF13_TRIUA